MADDKPEDQEHQDQEHQEQAEGQDLVDDDPKGPVTREELKDLKGEMNMFFGEVRDALGKLVPKEAPEPEPEPEPSSAPEPKTKREKPAAELPPPEDPPAPRYGSARWFGGR